MKKARKLNRVGVLLLAVVICVSALMPMGCGNTPSETTSAETTNAPTVETIPESTPEDITPESTLAETTSTPTVESTPEDTTPESTPVETVPEPGEQFNLSYDLNGGIVEGNPSVYDNAFDTKIAIPVKIGYDFVGWTGTGIDTPTVSLTIPKGTEGDIALTANWVENSEFRFNIDKNTEDLLGRAFIGKAKAVIIVSSDPHFTSSPSANASNILVVETLQTYFEKNGQIVKMNRYDSTAYNPEEYDFTFYFGSCDCSYSEEFVATLNYTQYGIAVNEDNLCFIAWTEAANAENNKILYEIIDHVVKGGSVSDFCGGRYVGSVEGTVGADVPALEGLDGGTDVGEGSYQLFSLDSTKEIYDEYLEKLESAGYTFYTENVMNKTHCATYYNDDTVVTVVFAGGDPNEIAGSTADRSLRVIVDPMSITALPSTEKPSDADSNVTVSSVTLMYPHNLCMVFQLSNGHFIIFDSGSNGDQTALSKFLRSKAPDKNKVVIEAWIFSHSHQDHLGGFIDYMNSSTLLRYITINSIIYNFPSERTYKLGSSSTLDMNNIQRWYNTHLPKLRENGTTIYQARTGQKYYFGNAELEILWTFEDLTPCNMFKDYTNNTCIGLSVTIEGQKILLTGDSTEAELRVAAARYGEYLKSDFVQLAHHGSGNGDGTHSVYTLADAPVLFYPKSYALDDKTYPLGENEKAAIENASLVIRSGNYGTATLKLPFKVGDPIESSKTPTNESLLY